MVGLLSGCTLVKGTLQLPDMIIEALMPFSRRQQPPEAVEVQSSVIRFADHYIQGVTRSMQYMKRDGKPIERRELTRRRIQYTNDVLAIATAGAASAVAPTPTEAPALKNSRRLIAALSAAASPAVLAFPSFFRVTTNPSLVILLPPAMPARVLGASSHAGRHGAADDPLRGQPAPARRDGGLPPGPRDRHIPARPVQAPRQTMASPPGPDPGLSLTGRLPAPECLRSSGRGLTSSSPVPPLAPDPLAPGCQVFRHRGGTATGPPAPSNPLPS